MTDDIVTRLREYGVTYFAWEIHNEAADEIEKLRAERDEARREVCHLRPSVCLGAQTANAYADQRGWYCFNGGSDATA